MRNIRKAAITGLTAVALIASGTTAAFADEDQQDVYQAQAPGWNSPRKDQPRSKQCDYSKEHNRADLTKFTPGDNDRNCDTRNLITDIKDPNNSSNSSVWGNRYNAKNDVTGRDFLGLEKNWDAQPEWAKIWYGVTVAGVLGSILGLVVLPIVNQAKAYGIVK